MNDRATRSDVESLMESVARRHAGDARFAAAVQEVAESVAPILAERRDLRDVLVFERLTEPDRVIRFRVCWQDDQGRAHMNRAWRVQFSNALGPYKGGLRFHPTVDADVLKALAFEQCFKNALTGLPMGGGKGGSDFNPKGRSDAEVMRFCQAFMLELAHHIGADVDVPAGDIGVGAREIGYMLGMHRRVAGRIEGTLTGKRATHGGIPVRSEATGYGVVIFAQAMLKRASRSIEGMRVAISGSGAVALYAAEYVARLGGRVVTLSDSDGFAHDPEGIEGEKLEWVKSLKFGRRGRLSEYAEKFGVEHHAEARPWGVEADLALPCATQNEVSLDDARRLVEAGVVGVAEGSNLATDADAVDYLAEQGVLYAPGKAANAGGVAVSGLEMSQNRTGLPWSAEQTEKRLESIMHEIHEQCLEHGRREDDGVDYVRGSNVAGFMRLADALLGQGLV